MAGSSPILIKSFKAGAAIAARTQVKYGADDQTILPAAGSLDATIGVTTEVDVAIGETVDVVMFGPTPVRFGGAVTRGDLLTADANGRAIAAAPAAGVNARTIGLAMVSAVAGDIGPAAITPGRIQG